MRIFFFIIFSAIILVSCSEEKLKPQIDSSLTGQEMPDQESWNDKIIFTDEGKTKAVLFADHLEKFESRQVTFLDGVKIDFYDDQQKIGSKLTSDSGRVDDATQNMYAIGNVVAVNDSGVTLKTDQLMWRNKDRKIITDRFVTIVSPKEEIRGYGFESDQNLHNYTIFNITYITNIKENKSQ